MGSVTWRLSEQIAAKPDDVYAWLADLREDDHARPAYKRGAGVPPGDNKTSTRRIVSREGNVLRVEDKWGRDTFTATVTLAPDKREVHIAGGFGYDATWRAAPDGEGTLLSVDGRMGRGFVGTLMRLAFEKRFRRQMEADFRGHVEDLREGLVVEQGSPGGKDSRGMPGDASAPP